ncbi:MAG: hypothetical protein ACRCVS_02895 [Fusobacteriaceae bacterium]
MKKILIVGILALGTMTFANGFGTHGRRHNNSRYNDCNTTNMSGNMMNENMNYGRRVRSKEELQNNIGIQEKRITIRKLMLSDNVDWAAIEKINLEISQMQAKNRTVMMRDEHTRFNMMDTETNKVKN